MAGKFTTAPQHWSPIDISSICKLWTSANDSTEVRMGNRIIAVQTLVSALNHICAHTPRITFQCGWPDGLEPTDSGAPFVQWRYMDDAHNERVLRYRFAGLPRTSGTGLAYATRTGDAAVTTPGREYDIGATSWPEDVFVDEAVPYERGAASDGTGTEGISTYNLYSPLDICVHAQEQAALDIINDLYCPDAPAAGTYVLANIVEKVRAVFHDIRSSWLPLVSWFTSQTAGANDPQHVGTDERYGLFTSETSYTNLLDETSTTRTATTAGDNIHPQYNGRGAEGSVAGMKVPCKVSINYRVTGAATGSFKVLGPTHASFMSGGNDTEITTLTATSATWVTLTDEVYLNAASDPTSDATTARNKLDFHGEIDDGGETLYIYDITVQQRYLL